jgi:hypothetical protein
MTYVLILALINLDGTMLEYEKTPLLCVDHQYVYTRDEDPLTYVRNGTKEYATQYKDVNELDKEIKRQCRK